MANKDNQSQRFIYIRSLKEKVPCTEQQFQEFYREATRIRKKEQYYHRCKCPKQFIWACDGDCENCEHHLGYGLLSIDAPIYSHKLVLKPYAAALQNNSGDESLVRIQHLERLLEQNTEQRETLTRLMAQGYIDQVLYNSETNTLLTQANTYREDIEVINATMNGDSSRFFEAERLLHFAERGSMLEEYSEDLFERFVDHIQVYSRQEVGFVMKCGLTFKEMI